MPRNKMIHFNEMYCFVVLINKIPLPPIVNIKHTSTVIKMNSHGIISYRIKYSEAIFKFQSCKFSKNGNFSSTLK